MKTIHSMLGGRPVRVYAPLIGELDVSDLPAEHLSSDLWGLDIEGTAFRPAGLWDPHWRIRTTQLAPTDDEVYVLRMDDPKQVDIAQSILVEPSRTLVSHTPIDVLAVQRALGIDVANRNIDTHMLSIMASPDDARGQSSLKPVAARYGMPELGQVEDQMYGRFRELYVASGGKPGARKQLIAEYGFDHCSVEDEVYAEYAGLDALTVRRLVPLLVTASRAPAHLLTTERWIATQAVRLRTRGHLVDVDELDAMSQESEQVGAEAAARLAEITGLRPTQNKAMVTWLRREGVDLGNHPTTNSGAPSLAKVTLPKLLTELDDGPPRKALQAWLDAAQVLDMERRTAEIRATMDANHRCHPTLTTVGTVTGRMAGSSPNMQNFSKKDPRMRGVFVAEPGHKLIACDFAQIELRVVAALAGETKMIDVIMAGGDLHSLTAELLGIDRQAAKTVNFLIVYGGGANRLVEQLKYSITPREAKKVINGYWAKYPAINRLNSAMRELDGLRLISGRAVPTGRTKDGGSKSYANLNYLVQGSARELLVGAWRRYADTPEREGHAWMAVHDEWVIQVPEDQAEEARKRLIAAMTFDFYGVPIEADGVVLLDRNGRSRWMTCDLAEEIAAERAA